jgi:hypothetical protein
MLEKENSKITKPTVEEIYEQYIKDDKLQKIAERLFEIAHKYKMRNRWMSYNSFTFTYRGTNVFNITMRATMKNKGVRKIDPTNHFIVQLSLGKKPEAEILLRSQSKAAQNEYTANRYISCMVCAGTPEGQAVRNLTCENVLYFELSGETHPLCMLNFGYACHNPTPEQFEIIEQFIMARIEVIDSEKSK